MKNEKSIEISAGIIIILALIAGGLFIYISGIQKEKNHTTEYESQLFDTNSIMSVDIIMPAKEWEELLNQSIEKKYFNCDVQINGELFQNVGIRAKGNTSLALIYGDKTTQRYSFKLEFDHNIKGQTCFGLDKLVLNNNYCDATYMKEYLTYDMFQFLDADAPLFNFADISVNGSNWGLYLALEGVEESFCVREFGYENGYLYKPEIFQFGEMTSINSEIMQKMLPLLSEDSLNSIMQCIIQDAAKGDLDFTKIDINKMFLAMLPKARNETMKKIVDLIISDLEKGKLPEPENSVYDKIALLEEMERKQMEDNIANEIINRDIDFTMIDISQLFENLSGGSKVILLQHIFNYFFTEEMNIEAIEMNSMLEAMSASSKKEMLNAVIKDISNGYIGIDVLSENTFKGSDLNYRGDRDDYSDIWEGAVNNSTYFSQKRIIECLKGVAERKKIEQYANVDAILKYLAVHTFVVNLDSLSGSMPHNYYLYLYNDRLNLIPWDYNLAFGGYMASDPSVVINFPIDTPYIRGINQEERDFFMAILETGDNRKKYHGYLEKLVDEYVNSGHFGQVYSTIRMEIDSLVEADPTAFYSKDEYDNACEMLYQTVLLRADSIEGQLNGGIPSTNDGQLKASQRLVSADKISLETMGVMHFSDVVDTNKLEEIVGVEIE